jgi:hypothetical protein
VKKAAMGVIGEIHSQSGPIFQAIALSLCTDAAFKANLEATFADHPFDASSSTAERPQRCVVLESSNAGIATASDTTSSTFEIPKADLVAMLPSDWHSKIVRLLQGLNTWCNLLILFAVCVANREQKKGKQHGRLGRRRWTIWSKLSTAATAYWKHRT